jgi:hypothetical protein
MDQIQLAAKAIAREQKLRVFICAVRNGVFGSERPLRHKVFAVSCAALCVFVALNLGW